MAEVIAIRRAGELGYGHVEVGSAGVAAFCGSPASDGALRAAEAHGLDLGGHRSTLLTAELAAEADTLVEAVRQQVPDVPGDLRAFVSSLLEGMIRPEGIRIALDFAGLRQQAVRERVDLDRAALRALGYAPRGHAPAPAPSAGDSAGRAARPCSGASRPTAVRARSSVRPAGSPPARVTRGDGPTTPRAVIG